MMRELEIEALRSLLQDVPPGGHALVRVVEATGEDLAGLGGEAARDLGERLLLCGVAAHDTEGLASLDARARAALGDRIEAARRGGQRGLLVVVLAEGSIRRAGAPSHAAGERTLGPQPLPGARVLCVYSPPALRAMAQRADLGRLHDVALDLAPPPLA